MANTKVTKAVLADDAVGLAQLDITNDPSDGQALTAVAVSDGYNLTWADNTVSSTPTFTSLTVDSDNTNTSIIIESDLDGSSLFTSGIDLRRETVAKGSRIESLRDASAGGVGLNFLTTADNAAEVSGTLTSRMSIDRNGMVLIGQDSGDAFNDDSMLRIQRTGDRVFQQFKCDADQNVQILFGDVDDDVECSIQYHPSDKDLRFTTGNNAEALRIDDSQRLLIGTTNSSSTATDTGLVLTDGHILSRSSAQAGIFKRTSSNGIIFIFRNTVDTRVGTIETSASSTSYNTSSDYRLKENVSYEWDATTRLKQLKPARFNWIEDETNTVVDGFLAHEVSDIVPEAISGEKDAVDEDGNPDYQGIDQAKLVPLLVKTIQELEARIETLENN